MSDRLSKPVETKEQRYRIYVVRKDLILEYFGGSILESEFIRVPEPIGLPEGAIIEGVEYSFNYRGFTFLVWHESFPEVPPGQMVPIATSYLDFMLRKTEVVRLPKSSAIRNLWDRQSEWSQATFGDDLSRGPVGPLKHLAKEAIEAANNPGDESEIADCFLLVLDAARRSGLSLEELIAVAREKHEVNRKREWPKPVADEPVFHLKKDGAA